MKTIPFLPRHFIWIGTILCVLSLIAYFYQSIVHLDGIFIKTFVLIKDVPFEEKGVLKWMETDILLTVLLITFLIGLSFIAFSKTKIEDEMISSLRLYSWMWAIIIMLIISLFFTLFVYGMTFLAFSCLFAHLLLAIYLIIFYINFLKLNRREG